MSSHGGNVVTFSDTLFENVRNIATRAAGRRFIL